MNRDTFYAYFEVCFFSSKMQDLILHRKEMLQELRENQFVKEILQEENYKAVRDFLKGEYELDKWESLIEFFVENGILMMDVTGYEKIMDHQELDVMERIYTDLLIDIYETVRRDKCTINDFEAILNAQADRLQSFLYKEDILRVESEEAQSEIAAV